MRESRTSGSVGRAPGNRGLYPEVLTSPIFMGYSQSICNRLIRGFFENDLSFRLHNIAKFMICGPAKSFRYGHK